MSTDPTSIYINVYIFILYARDDMTSYSPIHLPMPIAIFSFVLHESHHLLPRMPLFETHPYVCHVLAADITFLAVKRIKAQKT